MLAFIELGEHLMYKADNVDNRHNGEPKKTAVQLEKDGLFVKKYIYNIYIYISVIGLL